MLYSSRILIPFLIAIFGAAHAVAQCTVVAAPGGNDANPGTLAAPVATPNQAVRNAAAGGVVCLRGGTYVVTTTVIADKALTIQSYPGEAAVLTASTTDTAVGDMILAAASDVTVQDLELIGGYNYGIHINFFYLGVPPTNVRIQRLKIHGTGYTGIKSYLADNLQVLNSEVYGTGTRISGGGGLDLLAAFPGSANPSGPGVTVRGNYIHDMPDLAIVVKAGTIRGLIENNRVERVGAGAILAGGDTGDIYFRNPATSECTDCIVRNNLVIDIDAMGLACWGAQGVQFLNNTVVNPAKLRQAAFFSVPDGLGHSCSNISVQNNVFVTSGAARMMHLVNPGTGIVIDNNHYYNASGYYAMWWESPTLTGYWGALSSWQSGTAEDAHSVAYQDPLLDASFKPLTGSPLIDSGATLSSVPSDYAGVSRPQGRAFDKGAFEIPSAPAAVPSLITAISGSGQSANSGTAFALPLTARVTDTLGHPVSGMVVTFSAPSSGASATFAGAGTVSVMTDANGTAATTALTANGTAGTYAVNASAGSLAPASFSLTNVFVPPPLPPTVLTIVGGTASVGAPSFRINGTITSNGAGIAKGTVLFNVNGAANGSAQIKNGKVQGDIRLPTGATSGTQFVVYGIFNATAQYAAAQSAPVIVQIR